MKEFTVGESLTTDRKADALKVANDKSHSNREKASMLWKIANRVGAASFLASLGILGGAVTGHSPQETVTGAAHVVKDTGEGVAGAAAAVGEGFEDRYNAMINDIRTGSPKTPKAPVSNPNQAPAQPTNPTSNK